MGFTRPHHLADSTKYSCCKSCLKFEYRAMEEGIRRDGDTYVKMARSLMLKKKSEVVENRIVIENQTCPCSSASPSRSWRQVQPSQPTSAHVLNYHTRLHNQEGLPQL